MRSSVRVSLTVIIGLLAICGFDFIGAVPVTTSHVHNNHVGSAQPQAHDMSFLDPDTTERIDCIDFRSLDGIYSPQTVDGLGHASACGLYLVGDISSRITVEFLDFNVDCSGGHLVGVLDGWEQGGSIFPPVQDLSPAAIRNRHSSYCGLTRPRKTFHSSGNFALIQYKLAPTDSFTIRVTFEENFTPCNSVALGDEGQFELRNLVPKSNCSVMIIHPQRVQITLMDVGRKRINSGSRTHRVPPSSPQGFFSPLVSPNSPEGCHQKLHLTDYVDILGGENWAVPLMHSYGQVCGTAEMSSAQNVFCETTVVRLTSSGHYDNRAIIRHGKAKVAGRKNEAMCRTNGNR